MSDATNPISSHQPVDRAISTAHESQTQTGSTSRWWCSVLFGLVFSLPFAWLLSYAAALPFFIGMFFFALFGLVIGAAIFRIAIVSAPYPSRSLVIGTTLVVLVAWTITIVKECRDFPVEIAIKVGMQTRDIGTRSLGEFQIMVADQVRQFLRDQYSPGGIIGYIHWVLTDGHLQVGDIESLRRTISAPQSKFWWAIRAALSIGLLAFGIGSQTLSLKKKVAAPVRSEN